MDAHLRRLLEGCYGHRRWIVASDLLAGAHQTVTELRALGAGDVFVIAGSRGTGPIPDAPAAVLGLEAPTLMASIRAYDRALGDLAPAVIAAVDGFDPDRVARVLASPFSVHTTVAGRAVFGARRPRWLALEDKTTVDALWRAVDAARAPARVVDARLDALRDAAAALDRGMGTVWVADNRTGWHGGATALRWVRTSAQAREAAAFLASCADRARVMPFLDGIPCSIHGIVLPDATAALRPCEMVVLRRPGRPDLLYAGMGSTWDPPSHERAALRSLARRVGDHLRRTAGYRGVFTVDGVMTRAGFRPTELNSRCSAGAIMLAQAADLPMHLVHLAVVEGVEVEWPTQRLEEQIVAAADELRSVRSFALVSRAQPEREVELVWEGGALREARGRPPALTLETGPAPSGGAVRVVVDVARHPAGRPVAPVIAAALTYADRRWDLGLGPLEPAVDVTP